MATTVLGLKTFTASDPVDYNEVNDNYNKIDNGVKTALQGRAAHNLLDNSWFVNPINQRGATSYSSQGYSIDRWKSEIAYGTSFSISVSSGKLIISKSGGIFRFYQILNNDMLGKTVTYAVKTSDGIFSGTCVVSNTINNVRIGSHNAYLSVYISDSGKTIFSIFFDDSSDDTIEIYWAALYEGSYTAETLPAYQPKGYAAELAECQRYFIRVSNSAAYGVISGTGCVVKVPLPTTMRNGVTPTATLDSAVWAYTHEGYVGLTFIGTMYSTNTASLHFTLETETSARCCVVPDLSFNISADL